MDAHAKIAEAVRAEFQKHKFDVFVDNPPSMAQGGKGVVVFGCVICKVRLNTTGQFVEHLEEKVHEAIVRG